jgi:uncharacterized protein YxjI
MFVAVKYNECMKSFAEIKKLKEKGDTLRVAEIAGCTLENVRLVINKMRPDNYNIQRIFSDIIEHRQRLTARFKNQKQAA